MKTLLPPVTGTLAVFVLALALFIWRQSHVIADLQEALARRQEAEVQLRREHEQALRDRERALGELRQSVAQLQRELVVVRAAAGYDSAGGELSSGAFLSEFRLRQLRRIVQERYGELFDRLGLSPATLEQLKRLLVELENATIWAPDPGADGAATDAASRRTAADIHADIYDLLGYDAYMAFDRYGRELTLARPLVRRFAIDAADAGHPLSAAQQSALSRIVFEVTDSQTNADAVKPGAHVPDAATGLTPIDQQLLARAADVLSSNQLDLFRSFRIRERENLAAWRRAVSADGSGQGGAVRAPPEATSAAP